MFRGRRCHKCGTSHKPRQCPAFHDICDVCGKKATGKHVAIQKEKVVDTADFETEARIHMIEVTVEITENRSTPKIFKKKRYRVLIPSMKQMEKCTRKLSILSQLVQQMHG